MLGYTFYETDNRIKRYIESLLKELQVKKLKNLMDYANTWIPYYRNKFKQIGNYLRKIDTYQVVFISILKKSKKEI